MCGPGEAIRTEATASRRHGGFLDSPIRTDKNSLWLWDESNIQKKEQYGKKKNHKICGIFFAVRGKSVTRGFCVGITETKNKIFALPWQKKVMFTRSYG